MISILDTDRVALLQGDCLEVLKQLTPDSVDAVVTDPPYGLSFMNKAWDYDVPKAEVWREVLRVLKPGGHLLSFFGSRTYHRGVVQIEDAGFEIRDSLIWMYGTGFPKSLNVGKAIDEVNGDEREIVGVNGTKAVGLTDRGYTSRIPNVVTRGSSDWEGWGTALKPAHEPIVLARKPLVGTVVANVQAHGTGALNIDGCRIAANDADSTGRKGSGGKGNGGVYGESKLYDSEASALGRWPANVVLDEEAAELLDQSVAPSTSRKGKPRGSKSPGEGWGMTATGAEYNDAGGPSRFYFCAKASASERERGCDHLPAKTGGEATDRVDGSIGVDNPRAGAGRGGGRRNHHPTVKPIALMRWLVRLVTPPGGTVLDPFTGSGTTGIAALEEGFNFLGIERDPDYCEIAKARIADSCTNRDAA